MASVKLENISKSWGNVTAVKNISLTIQDQEFLVLLGPSGCGKTTTMRMIAGLEEPSKGNIFIGEKLVNDELPKDRDVAMVFQNYGLYPHMSVYENIRYPLKVRKVPKSLHENLVRKTAQKVELEDLLNRRPRELSGGQRRRVEIARTLCTEPNFILLDEPFAGIDPIAVEDIQNIIQSLSDRTIGVLITDHNVRETLRITDRAYIVHDGIIFRSGTPSSLAVDEDVKRIYLGSDFRLD